MSCVELQLKSIFQLNLLRELLHELVARAKEEAIERLEQAHIPQMESYHEAPVVVLYLSHRS